MKHIKQIVITIITIVNANWTIAKPAVGVEEGNSSPMEQVVEANFVIDFDLSTVESPKKTLLALLNRFTQKQLPPEEEYPILQAFLKARSPKPLLYYLFDAQAVSARDVMLFVSTVMDRFDVLYRAENEQNISELFNFATTLLQQRKHVGETWDPDLFLKAINSSKFITDEKYRSFRQSWKDFLAAIIHRYFSRKFIFESNNRPFQLITTDEEHVLLSSLLLHALSSPQIRKAFYPEAIFSDLQRTTSNPQEQIGKESEPKFIVTNNVHYLFFDPFSPPPAAVRYGKRVEIPYGDKEYSVGYNIFFPSTYDDVSKIYINVYGGGDYYKREELLERPNAKSLSPIMKRLLGNNAVVITLNLPDLQRRVYVPQLEMSQKDFLIIQHALKGFVDKLKTNPSDIFDAPFMDQLSKKPIYLIGSSFGGLMATRFLQLFPKTMAGAISINGVLSIREHQRADITILTQRRYSEIYDYLDPKTHIKNLLDPLLIIHNFDDHNVPVSVSLDFYDEAIRQKKAVGLYVNRQGSPPFPSSSALSLVQKGHGAPLAWNDRRHTANAIEKFTNDPYAENVLPTWRAILYRTLFARFHKGSSLEEQFAAEGLRLYREAKFSPEFNARDILSSDDKKRDDAFEKFYVPKLAALYEWHKLREHGVNITDRARTLITAGNVSDATLEKGLDETLNALLPFLEDWLMIRIPENFDREDLKELLLPRYKRWFYSDEERFVEFLWKSLIIGANDRSLYAYPLDAEAPNHAELVERNKEYLIKTLRAYHKSILQIFTKAAKKAQEN